MYSLSFSTSLFHCATAFLKSSKVVHLQDYNGNVVTHPCTLQPIIHSSRANSKVVVQFSFQAINSSPMSVVGLMSNCFANAKHPLKFILSSSSSSPSSNYVVSHTVMTILLCRHWPFLYLPNPAFTNVSNNFLTFSCCTVDN